MSLALPNRLNRLIDSPRVTNYHQFPLCLHIEDVGVLSRDMFLNIAIKYDKIRQVIISLEQIKFLRKIEAPSRKKLPLIQAIQTCVDASKAQNTRGKSQVIFSSKYLLFMLVYTKSKWIRICRNSLLFLSPSVDVTSYRMLAQECIKFDKEVIAVNVVFITPPDVT